MTRNTDLTKVIGFFDVRCPKCGKHHGWHGLYADRPPCPQCTHQEEINMIVEQKRFRDSDAFCMTQTLLYDHKGNLSPSEQEFIRNMYRRHRDGEPYMSAQVASIKRIHNAKVREVAP